MSTNKQALREAANGAEPEVWIGIEDDLNADGYSRAITRFIQHCSPATVLALLDELEGEAGRIKELESQRQLSFMASNRWAEKFREAENRNAEQATIIAKQEKWIKDVEVTMIAATDRAEAAEKRITELSESHGKLHEGMAAIYNAICENGASTSLSAILTFVKRAFEESKAAAGITVKGDSE